MTSSPGNRRVLYTPLPCLLLAALPGLAACGKTGPTALEARLTSQTGYPQVEWTGTRLDQADGFSVLRASGEGGWQTVGQVGSLTRTYVDKLDAQQGVEYRYVVAATRNGAEIARSPDGPTTSTAALPDTVVTQAPAGPLTIVNETTLSFEGRAGATPLDGFIVRVDVLGRAKVQGGTYTLDNLSSGDHKVVIAARDAAGNLDISPSTVTFTVDVPFAPKLITVQGTGQACTRVRDVLVDVAAEGAHDVKLSESPDLAGADWQPIPSDHRVAFTISDGEGPKRVYGRFRSAGGDESLTVADTIFYDVTPPVILITQPTPDIVTSHTTITVMGNFVDASPIDPIEVNHVYGLTVGTDGFMRPLLPLSPGLNTIEVMVRDCAGNETRQKVDITRDPNAPAGNCGT